MTSFLHQNDRHACDVFDTSSHPQEFYEHRNQQERKIFVIRLNRRDKRNAFDAEMIAGLNTAFNEFEDDPELWAALEMAQLVCRGAPISVQESLVALELVHSADNDFARQVTE